MHFINNSGWGEEEERTNLIFHSFGKRQVLKKIAMSFFATMLVVIQAPNNNSIIG